MKFRGKYAFLSNFYPAKVIGWGIEFPTSEHAYVACKTKDMEIRRHIATLNTPGDAKRYGRKIQLREDWDDVKVACMRAILRRKFSDPELRRWLKAVNGDIVEHNTWHDNFWGVCICGKCTGGQNVLGKLLMEVRNEVHVLHRT